MIEVILGTAGGLGLFLYGMIVMSEGLKRAAGKKLRGVLESMTKNRVTGCLVGAGVTALIQSSSAATVMVVGFVNAGLLTLKQAISVIIGTNIGTTATAWLVSISGFKIEITSLAFPAVAAGLALQLFSRRRWLRNVGHVLIGFGVLFIGIYFMKSSFSGLEKSPNTQAIFTKVASNVPLAILAGMFLTMLIQSSSAAVASLQLLAMSGAFGPDWETSLAASIPFILGSNIGTTITAQLAALGSNLNGRRSAWAHTMFNVAGALICVWFIGLIARAVIFIMPWELSGATIGIAIAIAHTTIKCFEAAFFLPLTGILEHIVVHMVPAKAGDLLTRPTTLEKHLLGTPELAMDQVRREIVRMTQTAKRAVSHSIDGLIEGDSRKLQIAHEMEDITDTLQYEITSYLAALSTKELSEEMSGGLPVLLHTVNDLERIGDHAVNIAEIAVRKIEQRIVFTDSALSEAEELKSQVEVMFDSIMVSLSDDNLDSARSALLNEARINQMQVECRRSHVARMTEGLCSADAGLIFIDLVDNAEKVGDHLANIAQSVIGGLEWDGAEPDGSEEPQ